MILRIILLGPPGAGKGTLAGLLKETFGLSHISTGDILREEMKNQSELGMQMKSFVDRGELVPDEIVTKIIEKKFLDDGEKFEHGFMLDGFPRTNTQAEDLDGILRKANLPIDFALCMKASIPTILSRLTGRRVCKKCGALFHVKNKPPKVNGVCDECSGELYQRADDNEKTIRNRIKIYNQNTKPIVEYYKKQKKIVILDANKDSYTLLKDLMIILDENKAADKHKNPG